MGPDEVSSYSKIKSCLHVGPQGFGWCPPSKRDVHYIPKFLSSYVIIWLPNFQPREAESKCWSFSVPDGSICFQSIFIHYFNDFS